MLNKKETKTYVDNVDRLITEASEDKLNPNSESTKTRYDKSEIFSAVNQLTSNNEELQNKLNKKGESNMDEKDLELFQNRLDKALDEKFKSKFSGLESDLKEIRESTEKACTNGDCFADKLDAFEKKFDNVEDIKTSVFDLKLDMNEKMKGVTESISKMNDGFTESISKVDTGITESITGMGEKLDNTCTGIECMNKRFADADDMVECPNCNHVFSLSANTISDTIVCPNCQAISTLD